MRSLAIAAALVSPLAIFPACADAAATAMAETDAGLLALMELSVQHNTDRAGQARLRAARLVRQAISQSPSVREARLAADAALQDVDYARAGKLPQLSVGAKSTVNTADSQSLLKADGTPMATLNADMPLYDWGRVDAAVKGREAAVGSALAIVDQRRLEAASDAVRTCIDLERRQALHASAASDASRTSRWSTRGKSSPPTTTKPSTIEAATSRTQRSSGSPHSVCHGTTGRPSTVVCDSAPSVARMSSSTGTPASRPRLSRSPVDSRAEVTARGWVTPRAMLTGTLTGRATGTELPRQG